MSANKMKCPRCGSEMNHHADKLTHSTTGETGYSPVFGGNLEEMHGCPNCGATASRFSAN